VGRGGFFAQEFGFSIKMVRLPFVVYQPELGRGSGVLQS